MPGFSLPGRKTFAIILTGTETYDSGSYIIATINEPPIEKNKSYKAIAPVEAIIKKDSVYPAKGNLLLYFAKDSSQNYSIWQQDFF